MAVVNALRKAGADVNTTDNVCCMATLGEIALSFYVWSFRAAGPPGRLTSLGLLIILWASTTVGEPRMQPMLASKTCSC